MKKCSNLNFLYDLIFLFSLIFASITVVHGTIECHFCGLRYLCPLPFSDDKVETISCAKSCMKFDGFSELDNKRVLVRGCGEEDVNLCSKNATYFGAKGTTCLCNAAMCNGGRADLAAKANFQLPLFVIFSLVLIKLAV